MQVLLLHPLAEPDCPSGLSDAAGVAAFASAAEAAGFDAIGFADHPAPSRQWVDGGGHGTFDPLTALAYCAAVTSGLRLSTYLAVLPYRNPWLVLKQASTADRLSRGRLSMTVGAGYLRSEFAVVGADFDRRNEALDRALDLLRSGWGRPEHDVETAEGYRGSVVIDPPPIQQRLPLLVGGNSAASRRRAATVGDGWSPMIYDAAWSAGNRTAPLADLSGLADAVRDVHRRAATADRDPATLVVQVDVPGDPGLALTAGKEEHLAALLGLRDAGATSVVLRPPADSLSACLEALERWGSDLHSETAAL